MGFINPDKINNKNREDLESRIEQLFYELSAHRIVSPYNYRYQEIRALDRVYKKLTRRSYVEKRRKNISKY